MDIFIPTVAVYVRGGERLEMSSPLTITIGVANEFLGKKGSLGRHARSRSPRGPEGYATRSRHHCMVVTLGFRGGEGLALLQANPGLEQHIVNVTELSDHQGGGPDGTNQRTQARVRCTPGFDSLLHRVLGIILTEPLIIIACNHGRHRSVAMAEIAAERIRDLRAPTLTLDVVHIDLGLFTPDQFRRLQLWS